MTHYTQGQVRARAELGLEKTAAPAWMKWLWRGGTPPNPNGGMARLKAMGPNAGNSQQGKGVIQGIRNFFNKSPEPTQRQIAITGATARPKAKEFGAFIEPDHSEFNPGELGRFTVMTMPITDPKSARTRLQRHHMERNPGAFTGSYPADVAGFQDILQLPEHNIPTGTPGKTIRGSGMTRAIRHERAEEQALKKAIGVGEAQKNNPVPAFDEDGTNHGRVRARENLYRAQLRRDGAIPYDGHLAPSVQVTEANSHPSHGALLTPQPHASQYVNLDEAITFANNTPMEQLIRRAKQRVRPSPIGDFPVGGRHQRALNDIVAREMVRDPDTYQQALDKAFREGLHGLPLHPTLEDHLVKNYGDYIKRHKP